MGYRESNEAHQRTAERVSELERELFVAREATDQFKAEKNALLGKVSLVVKPIAPVAIRSTCRGSQQRDISHSSSKAVWTEECPVLYGCIDISIYLIR